MTKKINKILLGIGGAAVLAFPLITTLSCGTNNKQNDNNSNDSTTDQEKPPSETNKPTETNMVVYFSEKDNIRLRDELVKASKEKTSNHSNVWNDGWAAIGYMLYDLYIKKLTLEQKIIFLKEFNIIKFSHSKQATDFIESIEVENIKEYDPSGDWPTVESFDFKITPKSGMKINEKSEPFNITINPTKYKKQLKIGKLFESLRFDGTLDLLPDYMDNLYDLSSVFGPNSKYDFEVEIRIPEGAGSERGSKTTKETISKIRLTKGNDYIGENGQKFSPMKPIDENTYIMKAKEKNKSIPFIIKNAQIMKNTDGTYQPFLYSFDYNQDSNQIIGGEFLGKTDKKDYFETKPFPIPDYLLIHEKGPYQPSNSMDYITGYVYISVSVVAKNK